jgi:hypothetical protein
MFVIVRDHGGTETMIERKAIMPEWKGRSDWERMEVGRAQR